MALVGDRVKETTTTTGTSSVTLSGAATGGFRTFNDAFGLNVFFYYVIMDGNGSAWETGRGYLSGTTTLVRATVHKSSNSNNAISLTAATHTVFSTITEDAYDYLQGKRYASARGFDMP